MRPTSGTTIQRPDLGALAFEYMVQGSERGFIGLELMPVFEVPEQSADYPIIPIEALLKTPVTKRSPRGGYNRGDYEFETGTYSCKENGWEEPVDEVEAKLYRRFFDAEEVAVIRATDVLMRGHEMRVAAKLFSTSVITGTSDVAVEWSTPATATPYADVETAKAAMRAASGLLPNVIAMTWKVFRNALATTEIKTVMQYTNPIQVMGEEAQKVFLANYFGVSRVLVGNAIKDSAKKGKTFSLTDIWDDEYIGLYRISSGGSDLREPCVGRTMLWTADSPELLNTESYREEPIRSDIYRVRQQTDEAIVFAGAGYLLGNITA